MVTARNDGPDPAPDTSLRVGTLGPLTPEFTVAHGDGRGFPSGHNVILLHLGTIDPGQTITRTYLVTGHRVGTTTVFGVSLNETGAEDTGPQCDSRACNFASAFLLTTRAPGRSGDRNAPTPVSPRGPALADTGAATAAELCLALLALALGSGLGLAARPRRHGHR